jgi:hypothetical protein
MNLKLTDDEVKLIIGALAYYAAIEAGQTQKPDLCVPADYAEYDLALDIQQRLDLSIKLRAQWETHPQTGELIRRTP